ncbi:hypothetical protein M752DRAFT_31038 [Aspergillus phoenicis ATCC 13157]|uniref:Uncharacterized protein n=1 Tax=Aspergillus phoenicis ATCC 13157 TaxID=1353007 RepID=A0A370PFX2_ASPPH|nr:hypothetical protein M752DRAFT_31038 [Aspergillus phoenicis ATCC 13157]
MHHQVLDGLFVERSSAIVADISGTIEEAFNSCTGGWHGDTPAAEAAQSLGRSIATQKQNIHGPRPYLLGDTDQPHPAGSYHSAKRYAARVAGPTLMSVAGTDVLWYRKIDLGSAVGIGESLSSGNFGRFSMFHCGISSILYHQKQRACTAGQALSPWRTEIHGPGKSCHSIPSISVWLQAKHHV